MAIPNNYIAGDYAGFESGKISVYYGYEQTDKENDEWCFVVWKNGKEVFRKTNSELLAVTAQDSPEGMLIAGLSLYLAK